MIKRSQFRCSTGVLERLFEKSYLRFIGSGSAFESENTTAYRLSGDSLLLIDIGELNAHKVIEFLKYKTDIKKIDIIITHAHMDHIGGLSTVLYYIHYVMPHIESVNVIAGEEVEVAKYLEVSGITSEVFDVNEQFFPVEDDSAITTINNNLEVVEVAFHKTKHVDTMASYSLLITSYKPHESVFNPPEKKIFYSGDSAEIFRKPVGFIDEWYQDISYGYNSPAHLSYAAYLGDILYKPRPTKTFAIHNIKFKPEIEFMSLDRLLDIQSDTTKALSSVAIPFELKPDMIFSVNPCKEEANKIRDWKDHIQMIPIENYEIKKGTGFVLVKVYHESLLYAVAVLNYWTNLNECIIVDNVFTLFTNEKTRFIIEDFGCISLDYDYDEYGSDWERKHIDKIHEELAKHIMKYRY